MSFNEIKAIDGLAKEVSLNVAPIREDVGKSVNILQKIVGYFGKIHETMETGMAKLMENNATMMIVSKCSELNSYKNLLTEMSSQLERKKLNLQEDLDKIRNRYELINRELIHNTESSIMKLDGHVINLNKQYFNNTSAIAYNTRAIPVTNTSEKYYLDCTAVRSSAVESRGFDACKAISAFTEQRGAFFEEIQRFVIPDEVLSPVPKQIPVYLVEYEDTVLAHYVPGEFVAHDYCVDYKTERVLNHLQDKVRTKKQELKKRVGYASLTSEEKGFMKESLTHMFSSGQLHDTKWVSLHEELDTFINELTVELGG